MGTLAIDIETASPDEEPNGEFDDTDYFELVAVALGYRADSGSSVESEVLFREGGWKKKHTAELLERVTEQTEGHDIDDVLTYNGTGFDFVHLNNWAEETDYLKLTEGIAGRIEVLNSKQTDLKYPAMERHDDLTKPTHDFPKFERVCEARSIQTTVTRYGDYDISTDFLQELGNAETVQGWHIGKYLGERYVEGIINGLEETLTYRELKTMIADYARADVRPLFDLYDSFDVADRRTVGSRDTN